MVIIQVTLYGINGFLVPCGPGVGFVRQRGSGELMLSPGGEGGVVGRQRPVVAGAAGLEGAVGAVAVEARLWARCCCVEGIPPRNLFDNVLQPVGGGGNVFGTEAGSLASRCVWAGEEVVVYSNGVERVPGRGQV